ncbi:iron-dependent peroxidase [Levilactobacillus senmaizukei DSM 21775 = NBRC 103853]|uniref:Iron-dependent peroxidase n=1 Tax=Levilactobacillus senmaizukei DSM 21775 = NBRC 103853 TaxID=1423803 RepID=A0A0R2DQ19_9LACO|nr:Dyp-type peroxidase [Levilactobacillus senmaizukei]KRN01956.1 iron-dependent peroxidase [Levilactobacillus senmaizukei DSM 21775 = NBRC 103853]
MPINSADAQDVYRDAGENIFFLTYLIDREHLERDRDALAEFADRLAAIERSMAVRYPNADLKVAFGIGATAWRLLFPHANRPKELADFTGVTGPKYSAPATAGDLFLHIRANEMAVVYELIDQANRFLRDWTTVIDATPGFRYFEGRAIIGFVDGTENPAANDATPYALIGDEDPEFINGSYAFAQKYVHNLDAWDGLATDDQEAAIGRHKFNDLELTDDQKLANAHNVASQDNHDDIEHKIVRMNVPYINEADNIRGTYFIGYARHLAVTLRMLTNMFTKSDRLLDFSTPVTGCVFFIPSRSLLERIAAGELID